MSSSMFRVGQWFKCLGLEIIVESCIFAKSLTDATMQNGGTRERSKLVTCLFNYTKKLKKKRKRKIKSKKIDKMKIKWK